VAGIYERLAKDDPETFEPWLAYTLDSVGNCLVNLARWEEALATAAREAGIYRRLAKADPQTYERLYSEALYNQSLCLINLGRLDEAEKLQKQANEIDDRLKDE
jgi:tetratricopeptide (TPR) repeat protein